MKIVYIVILVSFLFACSEKKSVSLIKTYNDSIDSIENIARLDSAEEIAKLKKAELKKAKNELEDIEIEKAMINFDLELIQTKSDSDSETYKDAIEIVNKYFDKNELQNHFRNYPELKLSKIVSPYDLYEIVEKKSSEKGDNTFGCEADADYVYIVYASVLEKKNGIGKYAKERENIIRIFQNLNEIDGMLAGGGTGTGHMESRLYGKAEYKLYKVINNIDLVDSSYNFSQSKNNYMKKIKKNVLKSLKSLEKDYSYGFSNPKEFHKALLQELKSLENNIINYKSLHYAKSF
jgi:hypothetical protein